MSTYENYDSTSQNYDKQRSAVGADVIAAMMQFHCGKPLKTSRRQNCRRRRQFKFYALPPRGHEEWGRDKTIQDMHVLDAGCGTGNYAKALIDYGVGHVTLLDASKGMLDKAKEKLADEIAAGTVKEVVQATMPPLPFPDASFDAVMFNLVLHHLTHEPDGVHFPEIEKVLQEARRAVKPGGVLSITTTPPPSLSEKIWFVHLNTEIFKRHVKLHPHDRQWHEIFRKSGFQCAQYLFINIHLPEKAMKALLDPEGPTKKEWRDATSYWASATKEEIKEIERKIAAMKAEGTLEQFVKEHDSCEGLYVLPLFIAKPV